jgi:predicted AlkP superfamily phosphohydrolase/phosphomutase
LKQLRPRFELYISPINIDPSAPELPVSTPSSYSADVASSTGLFYTQGMAEDTSALREGKLTVEEFLEQSKSVLDETRALFRYEMERFNGGLLFFYVSSVDQNAHMLWGKYEAELLEFYRAVDRMVGEAMEKAGDDTTLIVMSDHGFTSFDRAVHLNTVLLREGFLALDNPANTGTAELFAHVDWSRTQAYAMGLNGLYLNRLGREQGGIVAEGEEARQVIARLTEKLLAFRDPQTGEQVIDEVYEPEKVWKGTNLEYAPDLLIGYRPPYRASWQTPLGAVPAETVVDNTDAWIGDHCVAPKFVPGVLLSNRKVALSDPKLADVTTTIYHEFGVEALAEMTGRPLF